ncbi:MAG: fatty acid desaturase family protein [Flavobacteriales bacterium]
MSNFKLTLATRSFTKENRFKSWYFTLSTLIFLFSSLSIILVSPHFIVQLFFSVLSGLLSLRMFVIYHDYLHEAILRNSKIAEVLFTLFGYYILVPKTVWKSSHDFHHRNNSKLYSTHIGSFPVMSEEKFHNSSKAIQKSYLFSRHPFVIVLGYVFTFIIGMCLKPLKTAFSKHLDSFFALIFHFGLQLIILLVFGLESWVLFSIIPNLLAGAMGTYLFYVQHNFPDVTLKNNQGWTYEGAALESSSYIKMSPIMHWFTANIGYHHVHHLNSRIPFYRLPEAMSTFKELQTPKTTSFRFSEMKKCLSLKLWDTKLEKLIPISSNPI